MSKEKLIKVAEALAEAEFYCRNIKIVAQDAENKFANYRPKLFEGNKEKKRLEAESIKAHEKFEFSLKEVQSLTEEVNNIRQGIPELSGKSYFWDVPFSVCDPAEDDVFCMENGFYIEGGRLATEYEGIHSYLAQENWYINGQLLSMRLTDSSLVHLFLNKKKLISHLNDSLEVRYIYNVSSVTGNCEVVSYMNPRESPSVRIWQQFKEYEQARHQQHEYDLEEFNEKWDWWERWYHNSLYTNKERYERDRMSDQRYYDELFWRDYAEFTLDSKMSDEINKMRLKAEQAQAAALKKFIKFRKDVAFETNLIRVMPVGEVIYYEDELLAVLCYNTTQKLTEYDCKPDANMISLSGEFYSKKVILERKPALMPLVRHIASIYSCILPEFSVLKPCPKNCSANLWRVWSEIRFLCSRRDSSEALTM